MNESVSTYHIRLDRPLMGLDPMQLASALNCDLRPLELETVAEVAFAVHTYLRMVATYSGQDPDCEVA